MAKKETADTAKRTFDQELANWFQDARRFGKFSILAIFGGWLMSQRPGRQAMTRLFKLMGLGAERAKMETMAPLNQAIDWAKTEWEEATFSAVLGTSLLCITGLVCILASAFINTGRYELDLLWKGIVITAGDGICFFLLNEFWARRVVPLFAIGVLKGFITGIDESTLKSMKSFWSFLFNRPVVGVGEGMSWVFKLWRICGMIIFWFTIGSQYLIWAPLAPVKELLFAALPSISIFFLGTVVWGPTVRGREISWILWAELFMLIDILFLAVFKSELYQPLLDGSLWARALLMAILVIQTFSIIYIVNRIRRPAALVAQPAGGTQAGSTGKQIYRQPRPVNGIAVVAIVLMVMIIGGFLVHELAVYQPQAFTVETVMPVNAVFLIAVTGLVLGSVGLFLYALVTRR